MKDRIFFGRDTKEVYMCGKGGCGKKLCPVSFGLALGLTMGLGYFVWMLWAMFYGPSTMMVEAHMAVPSFGDGSIHAFWALVKGFVFGFFLALFYDFISCCCKSKMCCKKDDSTCCGSESKPEAGK